MYLLDVLMLPKLTGGLFLEDDLLKGSSEVVFHTHGVPRQLVALLEYNTLIQSRIIQGSR